MKPRILRFLPAVLVLTGCLVPGFPSAAAQEPGRKPAQVPPLSPGAALEKARLLEKSEQDPPGAAALYRALAEDSSAPLEIRAQALLGLARCLEAQGKSREARAALQRAALGKGQAAKEAERLLQGKRARGETGASRERVIRRLIRILTHKVKDLPGIASAQKALNELKLFGEDAVPYLLEECSGPSFNQPVVGLLYSLGGPRFEAWLKRLRKEGPRKRIEAFLNLSEMSDFPSSSPESLRPALLAFLEEPDPALRSRAARTFFRILSPEKALALAKDPSSLVRWAFWDKFGEASAKRRSVPFLEEKDILLLLFQTGLKDPLPNIRVRAVSVLWYDLSGNYRRPEILSRLLSLPRGRKFILSLLTDPGLPKEAWESLSVGNLRPPGPSCVYPSPEILRASRVLEALPEKTGGDSVRERKKSLLKGLLLWSLPYWKREDLPAVLSLIRLGYRVDPGWVLKFLSSRDLPSLLETPSLLEDEKVMAWVVKRAPFSPALLPSLKKSLDRAEEERKRDPMGIPPGWMRNALNVLALVKGKEAARLLKEFLAKDLRYCFSVLDFLTNRLRKGPRPPASSILAVLSLDWSEESMKGLNYSRITSLVREALLAGVPGLERVLPGLLEKVDLVREDRRWDYLYAFFLPECPIGLKKKLAPFYLERMGKIRESLGDKFSKSYNIFSFLAASGLPKAKAYLLSFLGNPDPRIRGSAASVLINRWGAGVLDSIRPLLKDPDPSVRKGLVSPLARILPASKKELLVLLGGRDPGVSREALSLLQPYFEPGDAPLLLKLCRSRDPRLRKDARAALENLRFIQEQERFWKRWGAAAGLGSSSLEALLVQASPGRPRKTRLLALRSLAALGDPKALPFLIEQTKDQDPAVAAQAEKSLRFLLEKSGVPALHGEGRK